MNLVQKNMYILYASVCNHVSVHRVCMREREREREHAACMPNIHATKVCDANMIGKINLIHIRCKHHKMITYQY
jgi:hypothetical protein